MEKERVAANTQVKRVRPIVVPLAAIGAFVGLLPVVLFIDRPRVLIYVAVACVLGAIPYAFLYGIRSSATNSPRWIEFLLGGVSAIYLSALFGVFVFVLWVVLYGLSWAVALAAGWLGVQAPIVPGAVAGAGAAVAACLTGVVCAGAGIESLRDQLYPDVAGLQSAFYDLIARKRRRLMGCVVVPVLVLGAVLIGLVLTLNLGLWIYALLQAYLVAVSAGLWSAGREVRQASRKVRGIEELLQAAGYDVAVSLRLDRPDVDPLLVNVSLFAQNAERALAVQVKGAEEGAPVVDWTVASTLQAAARRLDSVSPEIGLTPHEVEPMLVLVGVTADESLREFAGETGLALVEISPEGWSEIRYATRQEERRALAQRYLGLAPPGGEQKAPAGEEATPAGDESAPAGDGTGGQAS